MGKNLLKEKEVKDLGQKPKLNLEILLGSLIFLSLYSYPILQLGHCIYYFKVAVSFNNCIFPKSYT